MPKLGFGYNLAAADNKNKKDKTILKVQGNNDFTFFMT
jgi:hypothetical protein